MKSRVASSPTDIRGERQTEIHASCDWLPRETSGYDWTTLPRNTAFENAIKDCIDDVYIYTEKYINDGQARNLLIIIFLFQTALEEGGTPEQEEAWQGWLDLAIEMLEALEVKLGIPEGDVMSFLNGTTFVVK